MARNTRPGNVIGNIRNRPDPPPGDPDKADKRARRRDYLNRNTATGGNDPYLTQSTTPTGRLSRNSRYYNMGQRGYDPPSLPVDQRPKREFDLRGAAKKRLSNTSPMKGRK